MVYEIKCSQCGKVIDFGGSGEPEIPDNAIEWNGEVFCEECVKEFVKLGVGDVKARVEKLELAMDQVSSAIDIDYNLPEETG